MDYTQRVEQLRAMLAEIETAQTLAQLQLLSVRYIGHDNAGEDSQELRAILVDFMREVAAAENIHWSELRD